MRNCEPVEGVPEANRYTDEAENGTRGDAGCYNYEPVTLEEEAYFGGWLPGARPTTTPANLQGNDDRLAQSSDPDDLYTIGMRGEPGWDDDPQFQNGDGKVTHPPAK